MKHPISYGCQHPSARSLLHQVGLVMAPPLPGPWDATNPVPVPADGEAWHHRSTTPRRTAEVQGKLIGFEEENVAKPNAINHPHYH